MKSILNIIRKTWFQAAFLLVLGIVLVAWVFAGQDMDAVWVEMKRADPGVLLLAVVLSGIGHVLRAVRWRDLLQDPSSTPRVQSAFVGMMIGYLVNFAVPRLGEVTRCALVYRLEKIPVLRSLGTVFVERVIDVLVLGFLVLVTLFTASNALWAMLAKVVGKPLMELWMLSGSLLLLAGAVALLLGLLGIWVAKRWLDKNREGGLHKAFSQMREGLRSFLLLKTKTRFLLLTIGIWLSYWSGPFCTLWAMGMLEGNGIAVSFAMFTMGSLARTIPIPAGSLGPYHFLVSQVLIAFGFDPVLALAAATVNHATQTFFYFLAGSISALAMPFLKEKAPDTQTAPEAFQE